MPSPKDYKRDLQQEARTAKARGDDKRNALRHKARRAAVKAGIVSPGDGKDLDHKVPLSKGGSNAPGNLRVRSPSANRSVKRNPDGSLK